MYSEVAVQGCCLKKEKDSFTWNISQNSQENQHFFGDCKPAISLETDSSTAFFSVNFAKYFRSAFGRVALSDYTSATSGGPCNFSSILVQLCESKVYMKKQSLEDPPSKPQTSNFFCLLRIGKHRKFLTMTLILISEQHANTS